MLSRCHLRPASGLVVLLMSLAILLAGCDSSSEQALRLQGSTFGTGWSLVYLPDADAPTPEAIEAALEAAFDVVNVSMNTYDHQSNISRFNRLAAHEPMEMDWDFTYVFSEASRIGLMSGGAYDVTVSPLLKIWGFGPEGPEVFPTPEKVAAAMTRVGIQRLGWDPLTRTLSKKVDGMAVELSSIAKGYGVDLGADALDELGLKHYMLEVGGEMQLRGQSPRGDPWRVAIERPEGGRRGIQAAISLTDVGVATSGDYRNYFERDGKRYSHLLDPRTGYPIEHDMVSATVVHPSTAIADAWATALCIMGADAALALAEQHHLAIYVIRRVDDQLVEAWSTGFTPYLNEAAGSAASG